MTQKARRRCVVGAILLVVLGVPGIHFYRAFHHEQANRDLLEAIRNRDIIRVRAALDAGADPNIRGFQVDLPSPPVSPLEWLRSLLTGQLTQSSPFRTGSHRSTLPPPILIVAEDLGETDVVDLLLLRGAKPDLRASSGMTTLMLAAGRGQTDIIDALLRRGADVNARTPNGQTALTTAIASNREEAARSLLRRGADVNARNAQGETPLILTVRAIEPGTGIGMMGGFVPGASGAQTRANARAFGLRQQATMQEAYLSLLNLLLAYDANVNLADRSGKTALMRMTQMWQAPGEYPDDVKLLLEHGANVNLADRSGETALMKAVQSGSSETVRLLLAHGADAKAADRQGRTTVMAAALASPATYTYFVNGVKQPQRSAPSNRGLVNRSLASLQLLLSHGADVNAKDRQGHTVLQLATPPNKPAAVPGLQKNSPLTELLQRPEMLAALKQAGARP